MSFYMGKTEKGSILHVSSDLKTKEELATDSVLPTTIFHSKLPYLDLVTTESVTINRRIASIGYSLSGVGTAYYGLITATIPTNLYQYFNDNYLILVECSSRNSGNIPVIVRASSNSIYDSSYYNNYSYYADSIMAFTDSPNVPTGGGYYNNNYANFYKIKTSFTPSSTFKYLTLSYAKGRGNIFSSMFLQTYGGSQHIDVVDPVGKIHIFNINKQKLLPGYSDNFSVFLDNSNFIISGDDSTTDVGNYSFVKGLNSSGDLSFMPTTGNTVIGGLDVFNKDKNNALGWSVITSGTRPQINKLTSNGSIDLLAEGENYLKIKHSEVYPISITHSNSYGSSVLMNYTDSFSFYVLFISVSTTINGRTVSIPSHYHIGFSAEATLESVATSTVVVTNYQGGKTNISSIFSANTNSSLAELRYSSGITSGNSYPYSVSVTGSATLVVFG